VIDVTFVPEPALPVVRLRAGRQGGVDDLARALGVALPARPNTYTGDAARSCAWIEPRAWLVLGETPGALPDTTLPMAIDVSDAYASRRLQGAGAATLLAAGTGLDLAALAPAAGCAHTLFADEIVVFVQRLAATDWRVLAEAPRAAFLDGWLRDAAALQSGTMPAHGPRRR
jgi:sarcosine oxidase subunit gamma